MVQDERKALGPRVANELADTVAFSNCLGGRLGAAVTRAETCFRHLASAGNRDRFAADPLAYAPQYGGFCAWAVAAKGELFSTQPRNWAVVDGRLFLNFNDAVQETWDTDRAGFIAEGDRRWPDIVARA